MGITREMSVAYVVRANVARECTRTLTNQAICKEFNLNLCTANSVVAMAHGINYHFLKNKLWILSLGNKYSIRTEEGMFVCHQFQELYHLAYLADECSFIGDILYHIHFATDFLFCTSIFDESDTCTWKETLRMFTEKEYTGYTYLFTSILDAKESEILDKKLSRCLSITQYLHIVCNSIHVKVICSSIMDDGILITLYTLVIHQLHTFCKSEAT